MIEAQLFTIVHFIYFLENILSATSLGNSQLFCFRAHGVAKAITHGSANHLSSSVIYSCCPSFHHSLLIPLIWKLFCTHSRKDYCNKRSGQFKYSWWVAGKQRLTQERKIWTKELCRHFSGKEGADKGGVVIDAPQTRDPYHPKRQSFCYFAIAVWPQKRCFRCTLLKTLFQRQRTPNYEFSTEMFQLSRAAKVILSLFCHMMEYQELGDPKEFFATTHAIGF